MNREETETRSGQNFDLKGKNLRTILSHKRNCSNGPSITVELAGHLVKRNGRRWATFVESTAGQSIQPRVGSIPAPRCASPQFYLDLPHAAFEAGDAAVAGFNRLLDFPAQNERALRVGVGEKFGIDTGRSCAFDVFESRRQVVYERDIADGLLAYVVEADREFDHFAWRGTGRRGNFADS